MWLLLMLCPLIANARWPLGVGPSSGFFVVNDVNEQFVNDVGEAWVTP